MNPSRRNLLVATCLGARPFSAAAESAPAAGSGPVEVDIAGLEAGKLHVAQWKGKPVWILKRSPEMLRGLESPELLSRLADPASGAGGVTPGYALNPQRSIRPQVFVGIALCPHAGCMPVARLNPGPRPEHPDNWPGGFACQCHFATFDLAGRVFKDKPTGQNIEVPRHMYLSDTTIVIGRDAEGET